MLVDIADRHEIDAGRTPVELIDDLEVDPDLLDFRRSMQLVVCIEPGAGMFEFDFGVEDNVVGDRILGSSTNRAASKPFCHWPFAAGFCIAPNLISP